MSIKVATRITVTEPTTTHGGLWIAGQFLWQSRATIPCEDLEEARSPADLESESLRLLIDDLKKWLAPMPKVIHWEKEPHFLRNRDFLSDVLWIDYLAWGHFDLGDEAQTEALMAWIEQYPPDPDQLIIRPHYIDDNPRDDSFDIDRITGIPNWARNNNEH